MMNFDYKSLIKYAVYVGVGATAVGWLGYKTGDIIAEKIQLSTATELSLESILILCGIAVGWKVGSLTHDLREWYSNRKKKEELIL